MTDGFLAYQKYLALKQHFTRDGYDFFKYSGKVNAKPTSFELRKDKFFFYKLAKRKDLENFLLANFIDKEVTWVRDLLGIEAEQVYTNWLKRQQSLSYIFSNDINLIGDNLNADLLVEDGQHPKLLKSFLRSEISIESLIILNDILKFFTHWNKNIKETIIWNDVHRKCIKYRPFLQFNSINYKITLKKRFT